MADESEFALPPAIDVERELAHTDGALTVPAELELHENHPLAAVAGTFSGPAWEELLHIIEENRRRDQ